MMYKMSILLAVFLALFSCNNDNNSTGTGENESVTEIKTDPEKNISEIIRSPVNADEPIDTVNVAKMTFENTHFDFGTITEGKVIHHAFDFTNTGKVPLVISDARSTCGCTVPKWPKEPIQPGEIGQISVRFDSSGKKDKQAKPITITANTYPSHTILQIKGNVIPK